MPELEIAKGDAERLGIASGDRVRVVSARGQATLAARVTDAVAEGVVAAPMHWSAAQDDAAALINRVTHAALDPHSKQPELKHAAVRVERVDEPDTGWVAAPSATCAPAGGAVAAVEAGLAEGRSRGARVASRTGAAPTGGRSRRSRPAAARAERACARKLVIVGPAWSPSAVESLLERSGETLEIWCLRGARPATTACTSPISLPAAREYLQWRPRRTTRARRGAPHRHARRAIERGNGR